MTRVRKVRYDEGCAAAFTLGLVGDRWALLVVRELMLSPKRFQAIRAGLPGITASVLSGRLEDLAEVGVVEHDPALGVYALTESGRELRPVLRELGRWGAGRPGHDPTKFISPTALMMSLAVMVRRELSREWPGRAGFELARERFVVRFDDDGEPVQTAVREADGDFVLIGTGNTVGAALYTPAPVAALVQDGVIDVRGDVEAAQRFAGLFRTVGGSAAGP